MRALARTRTSAARRGGALILALIVVGVVVAFGAAYLQITTATSRRSVGELENLQAFYLAEAGLAESFQGVRVGRTGQIGSAAEPAVFGAGLLWVDATELDDGQVQLESTALVGRRRTSLALVVEPVEVPLGFFADEDLVVDEVMLVDGYDSSERTYAEELIRLGGGGDPLVDPDPGREGNPMPPRGSDPGTGGPTPLESEAQLDGSDPLVGGGGAEGLTTHTASDGLLASNGDVVFTTGAEEPVEVYGDVVPGPKGTVGAGAGVLISGSTDPRVAPVELPEVVAPVVPMAEGLRHDGVLPLLIPPGAGGYESLVVAADSEVVVSGPATVVFGTLVLEPGAVLSLDTRGGDVALYATGGVDFRPGSIVTTSGQDPGQLSLQVCEIPSGAGGAPVELDATSQFHGTIYAPATEVYVGSDFEVYGGVAARKLQLGAGVRLHFDTADYEGTPIPRIVSWKIVELPVTIRGLGPDPFRALGVKREDLPAVAQAHDLSHVALSLTYLDRAGVERTFAGTEDQFDWDLVAEVLKVSRDAAREKDTSSSQSGGAPGQPAGVPMRTDVADAFATLGAAELADFLLTKVPLQEAELMQLVEAQPIRSASLADVLVDSSPVSDNVLRQFLGDPGLMQSSDLRDVLEQNSPLSADIVTALAGGALDRLDTADRTYILRIQ